MSWGPLGQSESLSEVKNSKSQIPNSKQAPNPKLQIPKQRPIRKSPFGIWCLEFVWDLGFGIWDFTF
jgi:hypothetical protein